MAQRFTGLEPRHLATLVAVGEAGSFKGAGERVGYVQSAVSQQIAQLERTIGLRLTERLPGKASVGLTEAGEVVVRHSEGILAQLEAAVADMHGVQRESELRLGVHDRSLMRLLPRAIQLLRERDPSARLTVTDEQTAAEARARDVRRGLLDAALDDLPLPPGPFASVELLLDPIVLVVHRSSPLAERTRLLAIDELARVALIADDSWPMLAVIEAQMRAVGLEPRFAVRARLGASALALVRAGVGAALLPALAVDRPRPDLAVLELGGLFPPRRVALYWHAHRRRITALDPLAAALRRAGEELLTDWRTSLSAA